LTPPALVALESAILGTSVYSNRIAVSQRFLCSAQIFWGLRLACSAGRIVTCKRRSMGKYTLKINGIDRGVGIAPDTPLR